MWIAWAEQGIVGRGVLVDYHGWQEVYTGKTLWVYDARSNADGCVRLVSGVGAGMYGTAT